MSFFYGDIKSDELKTSNGLEITSSQEGNNNAVSLDVNPSIAANYNFKLPASLGSVGHVLKVSDATGNLAFAAESGGGSSALDDITAGDAESTLTTTTGKIIINPQANDLEMNVPTANKISLQVNSGEKMFIDSNSANIAVASNITGSLDVTGAVDLGSTLDVTGATTVNNNLTTSGVFTLGAGENEFTITENSDNVIIRNTISDKDILFNVNDGGSNTEVFRLDGSNASMLIAGANKIEFRDSTSYINSSASANLDLSSTNVNISATQTDINSGLEVTGAVDLGSTLDVTGATTINNNLTTTGVFTLGAGENEFTITESTDDITIKNTIANKDIIFNINNGSDTELLRLDGSATSMLVASGNKIEFRDTTSYINSSASANLDINSTNVNITATQTDVSGGLEVTGALTTSSTANIGGNSNITGSLDVTGDVNLRKSNLIFTATNGNALTVDVDSSIGSNYNLRLPASLGSVGHVLKVSDATGNLAFAAESGGGSSALDDITAGDAESTLTTTTGNIIIYPQAANIEFIVPASNTITFKAGTTQRMSIDDNSANIAVASNITGSLDVTGAVDLGSTLDVTGATTINNNLTTTGVFTLGAGENEFTITESTDDITIKNTVANKDIIFNINNGSDTELFRLDGSATSMLVASGNKIEFRDTTSYINSSASSNLDLSSTNVNISATQTDVSGGLEVTGAVDLGSTLDVTGATTVNNNLTTSGVFTLGAGKNEFTITENSDDIIIRNTVSDKDILFNVNDGGSNTEVFRLDGSNSSMLVASGNKIEFRDSTSYINSSATQNLDLNSTTVNITGALTTSSTANIGGNSNITGSLDITGATTVYDDLTVEGNFNASNTFSLDQGSISNTTSWTEILDLSKRSDFLITISGTSTLTLGCDNVDKLGQQGSIIITQSGGTNSLTWATSNGWYFPSGTAPTLSVGTGNYDVFSYLVVDTGVNRKLLVMDATNFQAYT